MLAGGLDVVVDVAVRLTGSAGNAVCKAEVQEAFNGGNDFRDGFDRTDVVVRRQDVKGSHVGLEEFDLACGKVAPVNACCRGPLEKGVVDVGDVLDIGNALAAVPPRPVQQVKSDIAGRVPHMGCVIRGDSADI
ncbi:hypothetical protein D9M72_573180 [compost metagenome]